MKRLLTRIADWVFGSPHIGTTDDHARQRDLSREQYERERRRQDEDLYKLRKEAGIWVNHG